MRKLRELIFLTLPFIIALLMMNGVTSCSVEESELVPTYGYLQFKLYKSASYPTKAVAVDSLSLIRKIKVQLRNNENDAIITQVLQMKSYNSKNGEYGLTSDKFRLVSGDYTVISFTMYNKTEEQIATENIAIDNEFTIVPGGLTIQDLKVDARQRGMVTFKITKEFLTKASESYNFRAVKSVKINVQNIRSNEEFIINKVQVKYDEGFKDAEGQETSYPNDKILCSFGECDTLVWLPAGSYKVRSFSTYSDKKAKAVLGVYTPNIVFPIKDNQLTEQVELPVTFMESSEQIKDYYALKQLWEELDGKNWRYYGEVWPKGCNWNFDKEIDMWGNQPGVTLDSDGRVTSIALSGFGATGHITDVIGQFTELRTLVIGTHADLTGSPYFDFQQLTPQAPTSSEPHPLFKHYFDKVVGSDIRSGMSPQLQDAVNDKIFKEDCYPGQVSVCAQKIRPSSKTDFLPGEYPEYTNNVQSVSKAVMRLKKLESLFIANSPIEGDGLFVDLPAGSIYEEESKDWNWADLESLHDIEIFNCPKLDKLPMDMLKGIPELQALGCSFNSSISGEQLLGYWSDFLEYGRSASKIQILFLSYNELKAIPKEELLKKMVKLRALDVSHNQISELHPFGKEISLARAIFDYNQIEEIPVAADGYFTGYYDVESFSFSNNKLTKLPDIFNAKSVFTMQGVNFAFNQISELENGDAHKGINATIVNLSNNKLKKFPSRLVTAGSPTNFYILSFNGMEEIPEGSLISEKSFYLTTLDLSHNKLKKIPDKDFRSQNLPFLQGVDASYNAFDKFPFPPLNSSNLKIYNLRYQRDSQGNACLSQWPQGLWKHTGLLRFFIGFNDFGKIDDTISPRISLFDIKGNKNISIDMSRLCPLIRAHMYKLIYDKTQDIRGCDEALQLEQ